VLAAALCLALAACSAPAPQHASAVSTAVRATPSAVATPRAVATRTAAPVRKRVAAAPLAPIATPVPSPVASPATPRIYSVRATPAVVHGGDSVVWDVRTTPDVVSVVARTSLYSLPLNKVAPGHFVLSFAIPNNVPFFFHGNYNLDVAANSSTGDTAHRLISLTFE
jgi:hypothetical protein